MSELTKTSLNEYIDSLMSAVENLETVSGSSKYMGELDTDDFNKIKIPLREPGKCHVFVQVSSVGFDQDRVKNMLYMNTLFQLHIIGVTDVTAKSIGYSDNVTDTMIEIMNLIRASGRKMAGKVQVGDPILGQGVQGMNAIRENKRYTFNSVTYTQKLRS